MLKLSSEIDVFDYLDPVEYLVALYRTAKTLNPKCSYQRFSDRLGFGTTSYSFQVINGQRPLSEKTSLTIAKALSLPTQAREYFGALCRYKFPKSNQECDEAIGQIIELRMSISDSDMDRNLSSYFSEWYHPVIREMVGTGCFRPDPKWIAEALRPEISEEQAGSSFQLLQRIGFIEFDTSQARWINVDKLVATKDQVRSLVLKRYHQQILDLARNSINSIAADQREINATTLLLSNEEFANLRQLIRKFQKDAVQLYANSKGAKIFQFGMQLFSVTGEIA